MLVLDRLAVWPFLGPLRLVWSFVHPLWLLFQLSVGYLSFLAVCLRSCRCGDGCCLRCEVHRLVFDHTVVFLFCLKIYDSSVARNVLDGAIQEFGEDSLGFPVDFLHVIWTVGDRSGLLYRIFIVFLFNAEVHVISRFDLFAVISKTLLKDSFVSFCAAFSRAFVSVMAFTSHFFHFCLTSIGIEKLGCGKSAEIGPGGRKRKGSKSAMEVELCGWQFRAYVSAGGRNAIWTVIPCPLCSSVDVTKWPWGRVDWANNLTVQ